MIHIVVALQLEARPLIEHLELKRDNSHSIYEIFRNDQVSLIVSGMGKIQSACATTYLLSNSETLPSSIFNLGFCGAKIEYPIGELYLAHRITDQSTGRQYYSDMILRHALNEASLKTYEQPVTEEGFDDPDVDLVDMEAAGFFFAASKFLSTDRIYSLKIVSDHLECGALNKELAQTLISKNLPKIEEFILSYATLDRNPPHSLSNSDLEVINSIRSGLRLTVTQSIELRRAAQAYIASKEGRNLDLLKEFTVKQVSSKEDGKRIFNQIREKLS